ncbi:hypothetical protein QCA50_001572 [Cerrena zonata]|uniref:Uncharacterized protein n=1 Tax=Cerrena zonata TaxID=2478898 RepID=A0AAW0GLR1_9APHY
MSQMATLTITTTTHYPSAKPIVSSPLASNSPTRIAPKRTGPAFPTSRPLRPFPSINANISSGPRGTTPTSKPTKIIEPPKNFHGQWVLNLTQAEFGRQD